MFILSFVLLLSSIAPQSPAAPAESRDLVLRDAYWGRVISRTFIDNAYATSSDPWAMPRRRRRAVGAPPTVIIQRETYILVTNTSNRGVKSVTWDYVFYTDAKHEREVKRFRFNSKDDVPAGETKFLTESVSEPAPTSFGEAVIARVEFEDGSTWQRSGAD
jgi:hypothetical protein